MRSLLKQAQHKTSETYKTFIKIHNSKQRRTVSETELNTRIATFMASSYPTIYQP